MSISSSPTAQSSEKSRAPLKILHLEDDVVDAELIRRTLAAQEIACELTRVDNEKDFEAALEKGDFSVILSDYHLPTFDGDSALAMVREKNPDVPFIFISGSIGEERAIEALKQGATDYILKDNLLRLVPSVKRALHEAKIKNEHRTMEDKLRQSQKMEAIGRLAGGIAHDFNNLLTVISSYTEMLLMDLPEQDPFFKGIDEIRLAAEKSSALTRQLLAFSRKQVLEPKVIDLNAAIQNSNKMIRRIIGEPIELETRLTEDLGRVKVDPNQFDQVMLNLIVNCRDAMPEGGKVLIETLNIKRNDADYVLFSVRDWGQGMTDEVKRHIFEPFFTTKEEGKGTGLGLATVFGIVQQSGGILEVDSAVGKGTTFRIYLPQVEAEVDLPEKKSPILPQKGKETILLVEDEAAVRDLVRCSLEKQGYKVLEAHGSKEALSICSGYKGPIHMLLSDSIMPKMSGEDVGRRVFNLRPEIKVLYISGYLERTPNMEGLDKTKVAFLQKPFTPNSLTVKVREMLDR